MANSGKALRAVATAFANSSLTARPPSSLATQAHKFVNPGPQELSGMAPGSGHETVIPKGTTLYQAQVPGGRVGNWFTEKPTRAAEVGINPAGKTKVFEKGPPGGLPDFELPDGKGVMKAEGVLEKTVLKQTRAFETLTDIPAFRSKAAPITDTWSVREQPFPASGGADQLLLHENNKVIPKDLGR